MVGKAPRRHAAAVTDELLPGVLQGAAPAGLGAVKPEGGIGWRLTVRWDRLGARGRHALRGVRLGHFTPHQAVAFITCRTQLLRLPNQGPAPISAEFWGSGGRRRQVSDRLWLKWVAPLIR